MDNLIRTQINEMARRAGVGVTDRHVEILAYTHDYYQTNRVGPLFPNIKRNTGASKDEIESLFPFGLKSVFTWVGVPIVSPDKGCKPIASVDVDELREVYLDHNATTYVRDEVRDLLVEHITNPMEFGNPSSSTNLGRRAYSLIDEARDRVAGCLGVDAGEVVFTGCGSEANNAVIKGLAFKRMPRKGHIITSSVEHSSVLESVKFLQDLGFDATIVDILPDGRVDPDAVHRSMREDTVLVSVMAVNNEIGAINPLEEIGAICKARNVPFMVDAIQGFGKIPLRPKDWGISALTMSGHKIYAPKGVGAMFIDERMALEPLLHGGAQEGGQRAGTENVAFIAAMGLASTLIHHERDEEHGRLVQLRDHFLARLAEVAPDAIVNGGLEHRVPHNLNVGFPGVDSGALLLSLNKIGIYVSSGSACHAGAVEASHVIKALGVDADRYGSVRFSFGRRTTPEDLDYLFRYLGPILEILAEEEAERRERVSNPRPRVGSRL